MTSVHARTPAAVSTFAALAFSVVIEVTAASVATSSAASRLIAVVTIPVPIGLVRTRTSPGRAASIVMIFVRDGAPDDDEAVLRLRVVDAVSADDGEAALRRDVTSAAQDVAEQLERERLAGPGDDVQRDERTPAHRVDVARGVGGGDPSPGVGVVHERREEVEREDQRLVVVEPDDGGVVGLVQTDEDVRRVRLGAEEREDLAERVERELAGAAGAVREARELDLVAGRHAHTA